MVSTSSRVLMVFKTAPAIGTPKWASYISGMFGSNADTVSPRLDVLMLPTVVVLDRDGRVAFSRPGLSTARELRRVLDKALASPAGG